jgi:hypothetical protein
MPGPEPVDGVLVTGDHIAEAAAGHSLAAAEDAARLAASEHRHWGRDLSGTVPA